MTDRRHFLKANAAIAVSLLVPKSLLATEADNAFHFVHADSCTSWPVADPVAWSLDAREPILERASTGLAKLTESDGERVARLVVRRCGLNLVELRHGQVVVHYWSQNGLADLRQFCKRYGLARPQIEVVLRNRKNETVSTRFGDDFLFGERLSATFPFDAYQRK